MTDVTRTSNPNVFAKPGALTSVAFRPVALASRGARAVSRGRLAVMLGLTVALSGLTGCASLGRQLRTSMSRYEVGNFQAARHSCSRLSPEADELNDKAHARFLVYCGLANYRLGDRQSAAPMLTQGALEYSDGNSNWLKPAIVDDLYKALNDLEGRVEERPMPRLSLEKAPHSRRDRKARVPAEPSRTEALR